MLGTRGAFKKINPKPNTRANKALIPAKERELFRFERSVKPKCAKVGTTSAKLNNISTADVWGMAAVPPFKIGVKNGYIYTACMPELCGYYAV